jgi:hypothetical protein
MGVAGPDEIFSLATALGFQAVPICSAPNPEPDNIAIQTRLVQSARTPSLWTRAAQNLMGLSSLLTFHRCPRPRLKLLSPTG